MGWWLLSVLCVLLAAPSAAAPPAQPSVQDSVTESLSATHHATSVTLGALTSSYQITTPDGPIQNERLILRNLDQRLSVIPKLDVDGRPDLASVEGMLGSILTDAMSPEQEAAAIWQFVVDWRYHYIPADEIGEEHDPVKLINVYGYGFCSDSAYAIAALSEAAGLTARVAFLDGHVVAEVQFDGSWHMFDADHEVIYRAADGHILSVDELAADPSAILATPFDPVGADTAFMASIYTSTAHKTFVPFAPTPTDRIEPVLQPLDEVVFDLAPGTVYSERPAERAAYPSYGPPPTFSNGTLIRPLDFSQDASERVIPVAWPFIVVGGEVILQLTQDNADAEVSIACDGDGYEVVPTTRSGRTIDASLLSWFKTRQFGSYACNLRVRSLTADPLSTIVLAGEIHWLFQFAPRALQQLKSGGSSLHAALTPVNGSVPADWEGFEIVHEWTEPQSFLRADAQSFSQNGTLPTQLVEAAASFNADSIVLTLLTAGGSISNLHVLLDTDVNSNTGYRGQAIGTEFMVENGRLYAYSGPPGATTNPWSWSYVGSVPTVALRADVLQLTIPTASLNLFAGGRVNVRVQTWQNWTTLVDELPRGDDRWQLSVPNVFQQSGSNATDLIRADVAFESSQMVVTLQAVATAPGSFHIFLDTDSNASTGYTIGSLGAEFLIEDGFLYRYTGTLRGQWSWSGIGPVTLLPSEANLQQVGIPLASLGLSGGARLGLYVESWIPWTIRNDNLPRAGSWQIVTPNVMMQSGSVNGDLVAGEATVQPGSIRFALTTLGQPIGQLHILLNFDGNPGTGYAYRSFGSDYLVENNSLYRFSGQTPAEWNWTRIGSVTLRMTSANTVEVVVPTTAMNLDRGRTVALVQNWRDFATLLDSMPEGPAGWLLRW